jgi:hypothetical protein
MAQEMQDDAQRKFLYLLERLSEPLGMGMKGPKDRMVYYNVPQGMVIKNVAPVFN